MRVRIRRSRGRIALAIAVVLAAAADAPRPAAAQDSLRAGYRRRSVAEDLQLFSQVLNQIRVNHVDSLDPHDLLMAAISGMVEAADPHSYVIPATRLDSAKSEAMRAGRLVPIPIEFEFVGGAPLVAAVAPGSKAAALDILPGDELIAVDGHPVAASSDDELQIALAGPKGSAALLLFRRRRLDGTIARLERAVTRQQVDDDVSAVPVAVLLANQTGYVRVTTFLGDRVADDLHTALNGLEKRGMTRLVLDLRGNGGGRVDEAKRIASEFLPRGAIVYTAAGRKKEVTDTARVQRSFFTSERRYPIVLLVDEGTASASELVAGALQDHDRALVVGRTTFGKSLLMRTFPLTDGSLMSLVVGELRTPCGRIIQREYRGQARRDYYLDAGRSDSAAAAAAPTDRPSCKTDRGRVEYGGGGIVPDITLPARRAPAWWARTSELGLAMTWAAGYAATPGSTAASVEALAASPTLPPDVLAGFRAYAARSDVIIPDDAASSAALAGVLLRSIAFAKFGAAGYYRLVAITDPEVDRAVASFEKANDLLGGVGK